MDSLIQQSREDMEICFDVVTAIRKIRGRFRIPPEQKVPIIISSTEDNKIKQLERISDYIIHLAKLSSLKLVNNNGETHK